METKGSRMGGQQYHEFVRAVLRSNLPLSAKVVGICLADFANDDWEAWPSINRIAKECNINRASAVRGVRLLTQCGWLSKDPIQDGPSARRKLSLGADLIGANCASPRRKNDPTLGANCAPTVLSTVLKNDSAVPKAKKATTRRRVNEKIPPDVEAVVEYGLPYGVTRAFCVEFYNYWHRRGWEHKSWHRTFDARVKATEHTRAKQAADYEPGMGPAPNQGREPTPEEEALWFGRTTS